MQSESAPDFEDIFQQKSSNKDLNKHADKSDSDPASQTKSAGNLNQFMQGFKNDDF